ncbi:TPA: hypothetical protein UL936_001952 [Stenotrophomonas maltophilia]|nr:hypothetical protein [Stenotrophomonas maltophilia]
MKQPPSTRTVFLVLLLVLAGVAAAGGAAQTISETLGYSVQPDRLPPSVWSQSPREHVTARDKSPAAGEINDGLPMLRPAE